MAAQRWRHHVRKGDGDTDRRDLQVNGSARALGPWRAAHGDFAAPAGVAKYVGFGADGRWYEDGRLVPTSLTESFSTDAHPFNSLKWSIAAETMTWEQQVGGLVASTLGGGAERFEVDGSSFQLRGDFHVRLTVQSTMTEGTDDTGELDNAVWFGVRRLTDGAAYWRVKHTRNATLDNPAGFAAEVGGVGDQVGYSGYGFAGTAKYDLVIRREGGVLKLDAVPAGEAAINVFEGAVSGILTLDFGVRQNGADAWSATIAKLTHVSGWHSYTGTASWSAEQARGVVFEEWVGDELDPLLWTKATTAGGYATPGADDDGRRLEIGLNVAGDASVTGPTVTGDFTSRVTVHWTRPETYAQPVETTDTLFALDWLAELGANDARVTVQISVDHVDGGAGEDFKRVVVDVLQDKADGAGESGVAQNANLPDVPEDGVTIVVERRGKVFDVHVDDLAGNRLATASILAGSIPTVPMQPRFRCASANSAADFSTLVGTFTIATPHALQHVTAWPTDFYGAGAIATSAEVTAVPGSGLTPVLSQFALVDIGARVPVWRIVGYGDGAGVSGLQALPGGRVGDVYVDPDAGRLVIPVGSTDPVNDGGFVFVDLVNDRIRLHRSGGAIQQFDGTVGQRQLGLGYTATAESPGPNVPQGGSALGYDETHGGGSAGEDLRIWTTEKGITAYNAFTAAAVALVLDDNPGVDGTTLIFRSVTLQPEAGKAPALVVAAQRRTDIAVIVYRSLTAAIAAGVENVPGELAEAIYTGTAPDAGNVGFTAGKVVGAAALGVGEVPDLHALRPASAWSAGLPLIAVARGATGATVLQDTAAPADAVAMTWEVEAEIVDDGAPPDLTMLRWDPVAVQLTPDADIEPGARKGWLIVGVAAKRILFDTEFLFGGLETVSLASGLARDYVETTDVDAVEFDDVDPRATGRGVLVIYPPPGVLSGIRVAVGLSEYRTGVLEYDTLTIGGGPWNGPHIGGTRFAVEGWGLDNVVEVTVGGEACFGLRLDVSGEVPSLSAVNRALGWIEHPADASPVMYDDELEATPEWPHDVVLRFRDGFEVLLVDAFVYESDLCIERNLRRLLGRLDEARFDQDPKANWLQRHILVALAFLICRVRRAFHTPLERDTYRAEAIGEGLEHLAASYDAAEPYGGMSDAQLRAWILAKAFGNRVTVKAIKDVLEPILGVRPTITEGYREFTVHVEALPQGEDFPANFFADEDDPDLTTGAFYDRDFWGGDDPRIVAARRVLDIVRAAGVRANLVFGTEEVEA